MSNFTKSILYSTTVLAAGLVAIFAIYNNVTTSKDGTSVASIAPASGENSLGVNFGETVNSISAGAAEAMKSAGESVTDTAASAMETAKQATATSADALNNIATSAGEVVSDKVENIAEAITDAVEPTENDAIEAVETATEGASKEAVEEAIEDVKPATGEEVTTNIAEDSIEATTDLHVEGATKSVEGAAKGIMGH